MKQWVLPIASSYRSPVIHALVLQTVVVVLCRVCVLDFGQSAQICGLALIAFWLGTVLVWWRRPMAPTALDILWIRWGYLVVLLVSAVLIPAIWRLRMVI
ncbi:MAG: hypothetical protein ACKV19_04355 [Verrucomicrobiales bacterium]